MNRIFDSKSHEKQISVGDYQNAVNIS